MPDVNINNGKDVKWMPSRAVNAFPYDVNEIVQSARLLSTNSAQFLTLQLQPSALGIASVMLHQEDGRLRVQFIVEESSAREALQANSAQLKDTLLAVGMQQVTIEVRQTSSEQKPMDFSARDSDERNAQQEQSHDRSYDHKESIPNYTRRYIPRSLGYNSFELVA
ncbi:MAG: flagellar hook-length control protein FliK [Calditrichaeota bacterium]|nr:flagellar hook-length control protein FliK [Calditrichota bacterium]